MLHLNRPGIYHVAGREKLSRFALGSLIAGLHAEVNPSVVAGTLKDYHGAPRSPDTTLNCDKLQDLLSFPLPKFSEWLQS